MLETPLTHYVLFISVLKRKSKMAVQPLDTRSRRSPKCGRALWGKRLQCSPPVPSFFPKHLHSVSVRDRDCRATQMFALVGYPFSSALLLPSLMSGSIHAPGRWHQAQLQPNFQPAVPTAGQERATEPGSAERKRPAALVWLSQSTR